jgi:endoglucanase
LETLPNAATQRVWQQIAPRFKNDKGVVFELFNEPSLKPSDANWAAWAKTMNATISTIRSLGAVNVVVVDGLNSAQDLTGAPALTDPLQEIAYADHPYANNASEATRTIWDQKFGNFAQTAPVIITEWGTGYDKTPAGTCDPTTPQTTAKFLNYLQNRGIGLKIGAWDWAAASFGTVRYDFPDNGFTSYMGANGPLACNDPAFGPGATVEVCFKSGIPASSPQ